jgi:hypothetical protein
MRMEMLVAVKDDIMMKVFAKNILTNRTWFNSNALLGYSANSCVVVTLGGSERDIFETTTPAPRLVLGLWAESLGFQTRERAWQELIKLISEFREVEPIVDKSTNCSQWLVSISSPD